MVCLALPPWPFFLGADIGFALLRTDVRIRTSDFKTRGKQHVFFLVALLNLKKKATRYHVCTYVHVRLSDRST